MRVLLSLAFILCVGAVQAQTRPDLSRIDPFETQSLTKISRYCSSLWQGGQNSGPSGWALEDQDLCVRSFYCGDGGCEPQRLVVAVRASAWDAFVAKAGALPFETVRLCDANDPFEAQFRDIASKSQYVPYFEELGARFDGVEHITYCTKVRPGYELEVLFALRQWGGRDIVAVRTGGEAGSPSALMWISATQFYHLRDQATQPLRPVVKQAIEDVLDIRCESNDAMTCAIVPEAGKLKVLLLLSDGAMTGRGGIWERTYWEIYPHWMGGDDQYSLSFDMPVTAIKRWPADGAKPRQGFQSLDFDEGFEAFRLSVMSRVADVIGADVQEPWY